MQMKMWRDMYMWRLALLMESAIIFILRNKVIFSSIFCIYRVPFFSREKRLEAWSECGPNHPPFTCFSSLSSLAFGSHHLFVFSSNYSTLNERVYKFMWNPGMPTLSINIFQPWPNLQAGWEPAAWAERTDFCCWRDFLRHVFVMMTSRENFLGSRFAPKRGLILVIIMHSEIKSYFEDTPVLGWTYPGFLRALKPFCVADCYGSLEDQNSIWRKRFNTFLKEFLDGIKGNEEEREYVALLLKEVCKFLLLNLSRALADSQGAPGGAVGVPWGCCSFSRSSSRPPRVPCALFVSEECCWGAVGVLLGCRFTFLFSSFPCSSSVLFRVLCALFVFFFLKKLETFNLLAFILGFFKRVQVNAFWKNVQVEREITNQADRERVSFMVPLIISTFRILIRLFLYLRWLPSISRMSTH